MTSANGPRPEIFTPIDAIFEFPSNTPENRQLEAVGLFSINSSLVALEASSSDDIDADVPAMIAGVLKQLDPTACDFDHRMRTIPTDLPFIGEWNVERRLPVVAEPDTGALLRTQLRVVHRRPWHEQTQELQDAVQILHDAEASARNPQPRRRPYRSRLAEIYGVSGERRLFGLGGYTFEDPQALTALQRGAGQELLEGFGAVKAQTNIVVEMRKGAHSARLLDVAVLKAIPGDTTIDSQTMRKRWSLLSTVLTKDIA